MLFVWDLFCKECFETFFLGSIKGQRSKKIIKDSKNNIFILLKRCTCYTCYGQYLLREKVFWPLLKCGSRKIKKKSCVSTWIGHAFNASIDISFDTSSMKKTRLFRDNNDFLKMPINTRTFEELKTWTYKQIFEIYFFLFFELSLWNFLSCKKISKHVAYFERKD